MQYLDQQTNGMPPLRTSSSGMGQDSWGSQSRTASAGETSISDIHHRLVEVLLPTHVGFTRALVETNTLSKRINGYLPFRPAPVVPISTSSDMTATAVIAGEGAYLTELCQAVQCRDSWDVSHPGTLLSFSH